jgi:hypothetical protein
MQRKLLDFCEFPIETKWQLLYRASEHGFGAHNFHSNCDNHANTLSVVRSTNGSVFGGYTQQLWNGTGQRADKNAFIFSLINKDNQPVKMKIKLPERAIFCRPDHGPMFGVANCDFFICDYSNLNLNSGSPDLGQTYAHPRYAHGSSEAKSFLAGSERFQVAEIEVFKLDTK